LLFFALPAGRALCSPFSFLVFLFLFFFFFFFFLHSFAFLFSSLAFSFEPSSLFFFRASGHLLFLQTFKHPDIQTSTGDIININIQIQKKLPTQWKHTTHPFCVFMACFSFSSFSTSVGGFLSSHFRFLII